MSQVTAYTSHHSETHRSSSRNITSDKILVMDDDDGLRRILSISLSHLGYQVVCVRDGAAAIEAYETAKTLGEPFSALMLDLQIEGGMGGEETLAHLRADEPEIKAILCSAADYDPVMQHYEAYGFAARLPKPFRRADLQTILQRVIDAPSETALSAN